MQDWLFKEQSASAPASLMLMGEHGVLQGSHAISSAVNLRMHVHVKPRSDDQVMIHSALGTYRGVIGKLAPDPRFEYVLGCLEGLTSGLELHIESDFSHTVGLGSSAAVTVATLGALHGTQVDRLQLFHESIKVVRQVQKIASGADVAASVFGGSVLYRMEPFAIEPLGALLPLTLIYSGSKMATKEVIEQVLARQKKQPKAFKALYELMNELVLEAKAAIQNRDLAALGELFTLHHGLQEAIGTSNGVLSDIVHRLQQQPEIYGAKISGSGLGDSCIGLGRCTLTSPYLQIPVEMAQEGITIQ